MIADAGTANWVGNLRRSVTIEVFLHVGAMVGHARHSHTVRFDGSTLASGTYVYRLEAGSTVRQLRMTLIK